MSLRKDDVVFAILASSTHFCVIIFAFVSAFVSDCRGQRVFYPIPLLLRVDP